MYDPQAIVNSTLSTHNITLSQLNSKSYTELKYNLLDRLIRESIVAGLDQKQAFFRIRQTGLKFKNDIARDRFRLFSVASPDKRRQYKTDARYAARLRDTYIPKIDRIPLISTSKGEKGAFMYSATVYFRCRDNESIYSKKRSKRRPKFKQKTKRIPRYVNYSGNYGSYTDKSEFGFWSSELLSRKDVINIFYDRFFDMDMQETYGDLYLGDTNYHDVKLNTCQVVAFHYNKTLRR